MEMEMVVVEVVLVLVDRYPTKRVVHDDEGT